MSTPTEKVSGEKGKVSTDLKEFHEDWISNVTKMAEWLENINENHFPSSIQEKISDMEHQIRMCIQALNSVPREKRESEYEISMFEYLKGRLYNAIPDVYNKEAEHHLEKATRLNPSLMEAWDCLGLCIAKKGEYKRAKKCFKLVLKRDQGYTIVLRRLADLELMLVRSEFSENPAKHIDKCIKYAQRALRLDDMDGVCLYILGCAHFTSFLLTGGWDHSNLQLALEAYKNAMEIDAVKSHPFLHYDCGLVNRYLENYKGFLIGFSGVASKNPASDALHQLTLTLQFLDKLEGLLQHIYKVQDKESHSLQEGKLNDKSNYKNKGKSKGKNKGKSMETSLSSLIQSLATIDMNPSYTRATRDLLTEGLNEGIAVIGAVRCLVKYEYKAPSYYVICDSDEKSFVLTVFGIQKEAIKKGDQVTLLKPFCKFVDFVWEGKHYEFKSVRVNLLEQVLVNGNPLSPDFASRDSLL